MVNDQQTTKRIIITPGEPAGIGPDIVLKAAENEYPAELIVVADPTLLAERAKQLGLPIELIPFDAKKPAEITACQLKIIPVECQQPAKAGQLNPANAQYVLACLELAAEYCLEKVTDALVTGPVQKSILNEAGFDFRGHTEFLAQFCNVNDVVMLFIVDDLKVAIATTHIPLSAVPQAITQNHLVKTIRILHHEMQKQFGIAEPTIYVCGLNPHAGEDGLMGHEEKNVIQPALALLRNEKIHCIGPKPADTLFTKRYSPNDVILGMYHDQVLPVVKHMGFDRAVNVTLGLPIIRTSVDHGTALDLAGTGRADPGSLQAAIQLACHLTSSEKKIP